LNYREALQLPFVTTAFEFDLKHLHQAKALVLVMPCGKSAHVEMGMFYGWGRPRFLLFDGEPYDDNWELMPKLATGMAYSVEELVTMLKEEL